MGVSELLARAKEYLPPEKVVVVEDAYHYAAEAHQGQVRLSDERYVEHPLHVALILFASSRCQFSGGGIAARYPRELRDICFGD